VWVDLLSGVARAAIGWAGPQAKSQGGRAGQAAWFPRGHTTRPVPSPPRRTSPSFFGNLLGGTFGGSGIAYPSQQQHRVLGHASPPGLVLGCIGAGVPTSGCCPCPCQKCVTANKKTQARREAAQGINARMGNRPLAATLTLPSPRPHARPGICSASHSLPMPPTLTDGADPTACTLPHALLSALPLLSVSSNGAPCYSQLRPRRHSSRWRRRLRCLSRTAAHWPLQSPNSPPSGGHGSYAGAAGQPLPCAREPPYLYLYALGIARHDETRPTRPLLPTLAAL
jgi:hypothetical protein